MPRKQRCRWIGSYPDYFEFSPEELAAGAPVVMTLDEFETIRLLDREGLTQEQCAERMGVSRPTVTAIYDSARKKVAEGWWTESGCSCEAAAISSTGRVRRTFHRKERIK